MPALQVRDLPDERLLEVCAGSELTLGQAPQLLHVALEAVDLYVLASDLFEEVLPESVRLNYSVYDLFYLVLARRLGALLATCNRRLAALARECGGDSALGPGACGVVKLEGYVLVVRRGGQAL